MRPMPAAPELFARYVAWLRANVPAAFDNLAPPATEAELAEAERVIGDSLPDDVKAVLRMHNGQKVTATPSGADEGIPCLPTLSFLSTAHIASEWKSWDDLRREAAPGELEEIEGGTFASAEGKVKPIYTSPGWIPLWGGGTAADYIGVDLDPDAGGRRAQIINFGRNQEGHYLAAPHFTALLAILLEEVEAGHWRATTRIDDDGNEVPWFGDPDSYPALFATLRKRSDGV